MSPSRPPPTRIAKEKGIDLTYRSLRGNNGDENGEDDGGADDQQLRQVQQDALRSMGSA